MADRQAPLLSAALIVRDEESFLPGCLASLSGIVDEVVVVDTGSTDATVAVAESFGARVAHHRWRDDFSEARNVSLELATGQWILYIDADERLEGATRAEVESLLLGAVGTIAFRIWLRPVVGATSYREYRLWRNDPRIRFEGLIHEKVVGAIHRTAEEEGMKVGTAELLLGHLGYEGDQTRKHRRNLPLLRRQLEAEPGNLFAWHHLSRVLDGLGRPDEAEAALLEGLARVRQRVAAGLHLGSDHTGAMLYSSLAARRLASGRDASRLLAEGLALWPNNCLLLWLEARRLMAAQRYEDALDRLDAILAFEGEMAEPGAPAYDRALLEVVPWDARGTCLLRLGRPEEAAAAYARASESDPADPALGVKHRLARARAHQLVNTH